MSAIFGISREHQSMVSEDSCKSNFDTCKQTLQIEVEEEYLVLLNEAFRVGSELLHAAASKCMIL